MDRPCRSGILRREPTWPYAVTGESCRTRIYEGVSCGVGKLSSDTVIGYKLVRSPSIELLTEVFELRARAWKARTSKFPSAVDSWSDAFDPGSMHFVACSADGSAAGAARITVTDAIHHGPDFETYGQLDDDSLEKPLGFISRLVVCPNHKGKGLSHALDEARIEQARFLGCKTILANTGAGERRIQQLESYGFKRLYVATTQASGPLANVAAPTVLSLAL